jgi:hypothetical protein
MPAMRNSFALTLVSAFALLLGGALATASTASAQVVIQGEVTVQQQQPYGYTQPAPQPTGYAQPQPYGASPYVATGASPQPTRYIHHSDPIGGLIVGGVIGLGGGFLFSLLSELILAGGYSSSGCSGYGCPDDTWYALTWIPVVGPWLGLGVGRGGDYEWVNYVGGILEDAGLILLILGLTIRDEWDEPLYAFGDGPDAPALFLTGNGMRLEF